MGRIRTINTRQRCGNSPPSYYPPVYRSGVLLPSGSFNQQKKWQLLKKWKAKPKGERGGLLKKWKSKPKGERGGLVARIKAGVARRKARRALRRGGDERVAAKAGLKASMASSQNSQSNDNMQSVVKDGSGGYQYKQFANGNLQIMRSPQGGVGTMINTSSPHWQGITNEIGPFAIQSNAQNAINSSQSNDQNAINLLGSPVIKRAWVSASEIVRQQDLLLQSPPPQRTNVFSSQAKVESSVFQPIASNMMEVSNANNQDKKLAFLESKNKTLIYGGLALAGVVLTGGVVWAVKSKKASVSASGSENYYY